MVKKAIILKKLATRINEINVFNLLIRYQEKINLNENIIIAYNYNPDKERDHVRIIHKNSIINEITTCINVLLKPEVKAYTYHTNIVDEIFDRFINSKYYANALHKIIADVLNGDRINLYDIYTMLNSFIKLYIYDEKIKIPVNIPEEEIPELFQDFADAENDIMNYSSYFMEIYKGNNTRHKSYHEH